MTEYKNIIYNKKDNIATITLNRPNVLNALNFVLLSEIRDAILDAEGDDNIKVIVLTGSGDKAFSAGADIPEILKLSPIEAKNHALSIHDVTKHMEGIKKPIIAKINGLCLGGGNEIAMACDFRIASDNAMFGQPEVNLGVIPGAGGTQRLTRLIGRTKAMEIDMLGDMIDANEAYSIGLLNKVVPADNLDRAVDEFIQKLLSKSSVILEIIKLAINKGIEMDLDKALYYEAECFGSAASTEDFKEGLRAFQEKRKAQFKGK
ncbi:MAG: enoyl-CoA hydratase-related protein [Deferribacterota bacterium]|nr:enoyl-CoA hydratase-related protein [Deferribacterota bacterium]